MFTSTHNLTEIKLFQSKDRFKDEISDLLYSFDKEMEEVENKRFKYQLILRLLEMTAMAFTIYYLVKAGLSGVLAIGALLLVFNSYRGLFATFKSFFMVLGYQDEFGKYASWWFKLFDLKPKIVSKDGALKPNWTKAPKIEFQNVSFSYEGMRDFTLRNINLTINGGEKIAIVGLNGAGKTTFIKLLARVYDPTEGQILVDGIDLREIDLKSWRMSLGVLFQDFVDYRMKVAESIAIGKGGHISTLEDVQNATDKATATEFIQSYEKGFDQMLWKGFEDGVEPSKGQRQKLAVARIFYRDALISILDEPTSAIDAPSEDAIFEELDNLPKDKSAILISHRMSAIKNVDTIVVLKDGQVVECGNHLALMKEGGEYCALYNAQAKRMADVQEEIIL